MLVGGAKPASDASPSDQEVCNQVREQLEEKLGRTCSEYTAVKVSTQVVAGTNFFIKIHIGNEEYIHARIFRPLPGQGGPELHSYQTQKTKEDPVSYF